jgi:hypothetical protein
VKNYSSTDFVTKDKLNSFKTTDLTTDLSIQVQEELETLLAIYGDEISVSLDGRSIKLQLTNSRSVNFLLPQSYPKVSPITELCGFPKGYSSKLESGEYSEICLRMIDSPTLFELISYFREDLSDVNTNETDVSVSSSLIPLSLIKDTIIDDEVYVDIFHGPQLVDRKSVFVAHVARISSLNDVSNVMRQLLQDSRISKATHNMFAYRFRDSKGSLHADNDDDGEDNAGSRLAELLDLMKLDNVIIVVSRWFGGVLLGPSRFRTILNCARETVEMQEWYNKR